MQNKQVSIYVHVPFCKSRCYYCDFVSCTDFSRENDYFDALVREIELTDVVSGAQVKSLFFGGGTPSSVSTSNLDKVFYALKSKFTFLNNAEITVEANPESLTDGMLDCLARNGVNRLSLGLQSANDKTLAKVGRIHTYQTFCDALLRAHSHGFDNVSADLIIGLPETPDDFYNTVAKVCALPLTHVSMYGLELHPGTKLGDFYDKSGPWLSGDQMADMYENGAKMLKNSGFERYEVSNFAKKGYQSVHNVNYWQSGEYYGFGLSAHGYVGQRYDNVTDLKTYLDCIKNGVLPINLNGEIAEPRDKDTQKFEFVMLGLRLESGISLDEYRERFGTDFFADHPSAKKLVSDGFLLASATTVRVSPQKFYVLNAILTELL